ncbi:MAG: hypothetical protein ACYTE8_02080 [Planctomycetota bacterium]|jgi:hypothetical protein
MNKRQKKITREILTVLTLTVVAVFAMINMKDWINRNEAMRAMGALGRAVLQYRQERGAVPPQSYIDSMRDGLEGRARLGDVFYRAQWIGFESTGDDILAYAKSSTHSIFLEDGYIVLRLNGKVEWMNENDFDALLAQQQTQDEIDMLKRNP